MPRRPPPPYSPKDLLVLDLLRQMPPGPIDAKELAFNLYGNLRCNPPPHWRTTLSTTLRRLRERGVPIRQTVSGGGRSHPHVWALKHRIEDARE